jgi:hypothetical protein
LSPYSLNSLPAPAEGVGLGFGVGSSIRGVKSEVGVKLGVGNQGVTREEAMGTVGFEAGIETLEEVEGGKVYAASGGVVQEMRMRDLCKSDPGLSPPFF